MAKARDFVPPPGPVGSAASVRGTEGKGRRQTWHRKRRNAGAALGSSARKVVRNKSSTVVCYGRCMIVKGKNCIIVRG